MSVNGAVDSVSEIREYLTELININTTRDNGDIGKMSCFLKETFEKMNVSCTVHDWNGQVCAVTATIPGKTDDAVLLYSHMDTAPIGNVSKWHFPADKATYKNHCICGRGSLDGKSCMAVWIKLFEDINKGEKPQKTVIFASDCEMENEDGTKNRGIKYILENTEELKNVSLAICEGGGIPFPYKGKMYYTFQTAEREAYNYALGLHDPEAEADSILNMGIEKGYYNEETAQYCMENQDHLVRRLETESLYCGMKEYFENAKRVTAYQKYGKIIEEALQEEISGAKIMPVVKSGISGNTDLLNSGITAAGFFPLDIQNSISGINGENEYITDKSIELAYRVLKKALNDIIR